jgi:hypothetical protein
LHAGVLKVQETIRYTLAKRTWGNTNIVVFRMAAAGRF